MNRNKDAGTLERSRDGATDDEPRRLEQQLRAAAKEIEKRERTIEKLKHDLEAARSTRLVNQLGITPTIAKAKKAGKRVAKAATTTFWVTAAAAGSIALYVKYRPGR